jgi:hypothetical protein
LYGEAVFKELFRRVLSVSIDKAIVAGKRQAINIANRDVLPDEIINRL